MSEKKKSFIVGADDAVPTYTLAAVFAISIVMGAVAASGVLTKPYEAKQVVEDIHERILLEKEMREIRRMSYGERSTMAEGKTYVEPKLFKMSQKTERAEEFDRKVRSDDYWASLQDSTKGTVPTVPGSTPVVIPPVIVGSAE